MKDALELAVLLGVILIGIAISIAICYEPRADYEITITGYNNIEIHSTLSGQTYKTTLDSIPYYIQNDKL